MSPKVGDGEGRAGHARAAVRPPGLARHGGALEPPARLLPEAQADQQPSGPLRTRAWVLIINHGNAISRPTWQLRYDYFKFSLGFCFIMNVFTH